MFTLYCHKISLNSSGVIANSPASKPVDSGSLKCFSHMPICPIFVLSPDFVCQIEGELLYFLNNSNPMVWSDIASHPLIPFSLEAIIQLNKNLSYLLT